MTDLLVTNVADAHVHDARPGLNAGDTKWVNLRSGVYRGYVRPQLANILGRTVLDARLVGRVGPGHLAQTYTLSRATEKWTAGRVTWDNQPAIEVADAVVVAAAAQPDTGIVEFVVTDHMQAVADGTPYYGWRLTTNSGAAGQKFYATDSGEPAWELYVTLSDAPEQPTNLRPDGGAVSTITPILAWDFTDFGPESSVQVESRVMVDTPAVGVEPDSVAPDYDSGWVANGDPEYALDGTTFNVITNGEFETNTTGWAGSGATIARSTAVAHQGLASLAVTSTAGGTAQAVSAGTGVAAIPVDANTTYTVSARVRAATVGRNVGWRFQAYTLAGADTVDPVNSATVVDTVDGWTVVRHVFTTGATTRFLRVQLAVDGTAAAEVHYVDSVRLVKGGGGPTYWRVAVRDGDGNTSEWSDWADFTVAPLPVLVIDSPTGPVGDPAIQVLAHLTGGTVEAWQIIATGVYRGDVRADSGVRTGAVSWEVPTKTKENRFVFPARRFVVSPQVGWLYVRVWDDVDRAVAVGEQPYVDKWIEVEWVDDGTQVVPTDLTVTPLGDGDPRLTWSWESTDTADAWLIQVDDNTVERVEADEVMVNAGVYTWVDRAHVPPLRPHTLAVRALRDGERSAAVEAEDVQVVVEGVWLLPETVDHPIVLAGTAVAGFAASDRVATYEPLHGGPVDIVYGWTGRVGTFEGWIDHRQDVWADVDAIEELRTSHNRLARMVWGSQSITVRVRHPDVTSSDEILPENLEHVVRFGFVEVGD